MHEQPRCSDLVPIPGGGGAIMNAQVNVGDHLWIEMPAPDSWQLASNRFEHVRYAAMLNMMEWSVSARPGNRMRCWLLHEKFDQPLRDASRHRPASGSNQTRRQSCDSRINL